jgi:hypothetical protein
MPRPGACSRQPLRSSTTQLNHSCERMPRMKPRCPLGPRMNGDHVAITRHDGDSTPVAAATKGSSPARMRNKCWESIRRTFFRSAEGRRAASRGPPARRTLARWGGGCGAPPKHSHIRFDGQHPRRLTTVYNAVFARSRAAARRSRDGWVAAKPDAALPAQHPRPALEDALVASLPVGVIGAESGAGLDIDISSVLSSKARINLDIILEMGKRAADLRRRDPEARCGLPCSGEQKAHLSCL